MLLPGHVFRAYDVRGHAEKDLSSEGVFELGAAFAAALGAPRPIRIAVARDGRLSSPRLHEALVRGLRWTGAHVLDLGVGPSPYLYFGAHHTGCDGAIQITGSHNAASDNGFKFLRGKLPFFGSDWDALRAAPRIEEEAHGTVTALDLEDAYVSAVLSKSPLKRGSLKGKVVVDAGSGALGPLALRVFSELGLDVIPLYCTIDGTFPGHHPDPTVLENLRELRDTVLREGALVGLAYDGDGDRLGVVDRDGEVLWGDELTALFAGPVLADHPGAIIVGEVKCSSRLFSEIERLGGRPICCPTGHSVIKTMMRETGALLAGEMSGHLFFADRYFGYDDALYASVRLLEILSDHGPPLRALLGHLPPAFSTPELRVACPESRKAAVVQAVKAAYEGRFNLLLVDGVRVDFGGGAWGLCRASNTESVVVLRFEAPTQEALDELQASMTEIVMRASRGDG